MDAHFIFLKWTLSCPGWPSDDRPSSAGEWHGKTSYLELLPVLAGNHGLSINISGSYFLFQYLNIFQIFSLFVPDNMEYWNNATADGWLFLKNVYCILVIEGMW